jgi:hypothetical protein
MYYINESTGEHRTTLSIPHEKIPYIRYYEQSQQLVMELSIPKYLNGENVTMLTEQDIKNFFNTLESDLSALLGLSINKHHWSVKRLDVCWNFQVGDNIRDYMNVITNQEKPRMDSVIYNKIQTAVFKNKSCITTRRRSA